MSSRAQLTDLGEFVVDLIPDPSGDPGPEGSAPPTSPAPVRLLARPGAGPLSGALRRHAELSGVAPDGLVPAAEPVSLAVVGLSTDGSTDHGFHVLGATG